MKVEKVMEARAVSFEYNIFFFFFFSLILISLRRARERQKSTRLSTLHEVKINLNYLEGNRILPKARVSDE